MVNTILVHLRGMKGDEAVLRAALEMARLSPAHLNCIHIRPNIAGLMSRMALDADDDADKVSEYMVTLRKLIDDTAYAAAKLFEEFCAKEDVVRVEAPATSRHISATFSEIVSDELRHLIAQGRYHDLIVVKGGSEESGAMPRDAIGRLILSAGCPVLLVPSAPVGHIRTVAIAWKDVPEAARAVTTVMPGISKAQKVVVLNVSETDEEAADCHGVLTHLAWHGLKAEAHRVLPEKRSGADALLEAATAANVDLLVMGAYGRSRLSEIVFGGFTQRMLRDASLPVLLFH